MGVDLEYGLSIKITKVNFFTTKITITTLNFCYWYNTKLNLNENISKQKINLYI